MNVVSLFSGVGGFDLGLEAASMKTIYQCEWDKHATNILQPCQRRWVRAVAIHRCSLNPQWLYADSHPSNAND